VEIFSVLECGAEGWFVWKRAEGMDVCEKIVNKEFEGIDRTY
jgi:hypothetical protein